MSNSNKKDPMFFFDKEESAFLCKTDSEMSVFVDEDAGSYNYIDLLLIDIFLSSEKISFISFLNALILLASRHYEKEDIYNLSKKFDFKRDGDYPLIYAIFNETRDAGIEEKGFFNFYADLLNERSISFIGDSNITALREFLHAVVLKAKDNKYEVTSLNTQKELFIKNLLENFKFPFLKIIMQDSLKDKKKEENIDQFSFFEKLPLFIESNFGNIPYINIFGFFKGLPQKVYKLKGNERIEVSFE